MVTALNLTFICLSLGLVLYGFFQLRGTVQVFLIVAGIIIGLFVWFYMYLNDEISFS